jgi:hypothetical protein
MRRARTLRKLRLTLKGRLYRLERRLKNASALTNNTDRDVAVAYVAIEALNAWALFSRSFYLSCAFGARTERKKGVTITVSPAADHLGLAVTQYKKLAKPNAAGAWHRRDEPAWHDPNVLMTVCSNLGCSIQTAVENSFTLRQNVFKDLPVFRNFFAHRSEGTCRAARDIAPRYTLPSSLTPTDILISVSPGSSTSVLLGWLDEIAITAEFMCKG